MPPGVLWVGLRARFVLAVRKCHLVAIASTASNFHEYNLVYFGDELQDSCSSSNNLLLTCLLIYRHDWNNCSGKNLGF